jgi:hypothetical protein
MDAVRAHILPPHAEYPVISSAHGLFISYRTPADTSSGWSNNTRFYPALLFFLPRLGNIHLGYLYTKRMRNIKVTYGGHDQRDKCRSIGNVSIVTPTRRKLSGIQVQLKIRPPWMYCSNQC